MLLATLTPSINRAYRIDVYDIDPNLTNALGEMKKTLVWHRWFTYHKDAIIAFEVINSLLMTLSKEGKSP